MSIYVYLLKKKAKRGKPIALLGIEPNSTLILTSLADYHTASMKGHWNHEESSKFIVHS